MRLPWRIDRPKSHFVEYLTIYYANSESQLLRTASRLKNLNQKLVGNITQGENIPTITNISELGASVYGDTLFDDAVLPDYIQFLESLVKARQIEQENFQENRYSKQETSKETYNQYEIQFSEELAKLVSKLGPDYQPNLITLGTSNNSPPDHLVVLKIDYFGPNQEFLRDYQEIIYWNDLTGEEDGYGVAIANGFNSPHWSKVVAIHTIIIKAKTLYEKLVNLKQERQKALEQPETLDNINITSERISRLQKRIQGLIEFPEKIDPKIVRSMLKKLNQHKEKTIVQKVLRNYTDGDNSKLPDLEFIKQLVQETGELSLLDWETIKPVRVEFNLIALLMRL
ncbi:hypothetical protein [Gloeocapsa sp. PCC 73106]|uniref:hypothetical protein n=1 Tax=Gloeocapsa sp. PCC 73106 TaxID=102232 RepID=UPI0002ABC009|nr:hypothetical protein [Gloeocapsa sp. PCC 73106]ELR96861.1 hypothetical protein GLO73106DRAFT_00006600 [Gloeocapsa sp. PCC 73106]